MGYSSLFLHNSVDMRRRQGAASKPCTLPTHNEEENGVIRLEERQRENTGFTERGTSHASVSLISFISTTYIHGRLGLKVKGCWKCWRNQVMTDIFFTYQQ